MLLQFYYLNRVIVLYLGYFFLLFILKEEFLVENSFNGQFYIFYMNIKYFFWLL